MIALAGEIHSAVGCGSMSGEIDLRISMGMIMDVDANVGGDLVRAGVVVLGGNLAGWGVVVLAGDSVGLDAVVDGEKLHGDSVLDSVWDRFIGAGALGGLFLVGMHGNANGRVGQHVQGEEQGRRQHCASVWPPDREQTTSEANNGGPGKTARQQEPQSREAGEEGPSAALYRRRPRPALGGRHAGGPRGWGGRPLSVAAGSETKRSVDDGGRCVDGGGGATTAGAQRRRA